MLKEKKQRFKLNTRLSSLDEQRTPDRQTRSAVNTWRKYVCAQLHSSKPRKNATTNYYRSLRSLRAKYTTQFKTHR